MGRKKEKVSKIGRLKTLLRTEIGNRERQIAFAGSTGTDAERTRDVFIKRGTIRGLELALSFATGKSPDFEVIEEKLSEHLTQPKRYASSGRLLRSCRLCGKPGHDARNCNK